MHLGKFRSVGWQFGRLCDGIYFYSAFGQGSRQSQAMNIEAEYQCWIHINSLTLYYQVNETAELRIIGTGRVHKLEKVALSLPDRLGLTFWACVVQFRCDSGLWADAVLELHLP